MSNSEQQYNVTVGFIHMPEDAQLTITDGCLETIYSETASHIAISLPKGLYTLKAIYIDYCQEHLMVVEGDMHFSFEFNYPSVAPALGFKTTHEYFSGPAEHFSGTPTDSSASGRPTFLLFGSKYDKDLFPEMVPQSCLGNYSITYTGEREDMEDNWPYPVQTIGLSAENSKADDAFGWFAHSSGLKPGLYFLNYSEGTHKRIFPFYVFEGFQTQFFVRYAAQPDLDNSSFYYSRGGFHVNNPCYIVLDKIIYAYKDYKNFGLLTHGDKEIIAQDPYLSALVAVLDILLGKEVAYDGKEVLPLPDLALLKSEGSVENDTLPLISAVMSKLAIYKKGEGFRPGSLIDRTIDYMKFDLFWNNFTQIDDPQDWVEHYGRLVKNSKSYIVGQSDNLLLKMSKYVANSCFNANSSKQETRLGSLLGKSETFQGFNEAVNSIGNVSRIADKLNIPPTTILRNYDTYNEIYKKMK